jgi:hypothetical protein
MERADLIISLAGVALEVGLTVLFIRRKLYRKYRFFFIYVLFSILTTVLKLTASGNYQLFFKIYWATEALYAVFALLALYEAFHDVFIADYRDYRWFWMVFPGAVLALAVIFIGYALLHRAVGVPPIIALILAFETVVNCVKGGLFVMFVGLVWVLGDTWITYPYGVVLGFAVSAAGSLLSYWLFSVFGTKVNWLGKYGPPVAYILAVVIWIGSCFLPPEPEERWKDFTTPEEALATVRQYRKALRWIAKIGRDR